MCSETHSKLRLARTPKSRLVAHFQLQFDSTSTSPDLQEPTNPELQHRPESRVARIPKSRCSTIPQLQICSKPQNQVSGGLRHPYLQQASKSRRAATSNIQDKGNLSVTCQIQTCSIPKTKISGSLQRPQHAFTSASLVSALKQE